MTATLIANKNKLINNGAVVVLQIPQEQLLNWHGLKQKGHDLSHVNFSSGIILIWKIGSPIPALPKKSVTGKVVGRDKSY